MVHKYKARLVAKDYNKKVDFLDTYSLVARFTTI